MIFIWNVTFVLFCVLAQSILCRLELGNINAFNISCFLLFIYSGRERTMEALKGFDIDAPRWDQSMFMGRLKHFFNITDCRTVLLPDSRLDEAKALVESCRWEMDWFDEVIYLSSSCFLLSVTFSLPQSWLCSSWHNRGAVTLCQEAVWLCISSWHWWQDEPDRENVISGAWGYGHYGVHASVLQVSARNNILLCIIFYIYIYICVCVCVCVDIYVYIFIL